MIDKFLKMLGVELGEKFDVRFTRNGGSLWLQSS